MRQRGRRSAVEASSLTTEEKLSIAEEALLSRRAASPVVLDMRALTVITDYFLICHGTSNVHIKGLADAVTEALEAQGVPAYGAEGYREASWVLLDYGDIVVHVFAEKERGFYDLERLWSDAPRMEVVEVGAEPASALEPNEDFNESNEADSEMNGPASAGRTKLR